MIPAQEYRRSRWRNGGGWTREIHAEGDADWTWRLSIAELEGRALFSRFPGVERELVLLDGEGLQLEFDDGRVHTLAPPYQRLRFAGERGLHGAPSGGRAQCFNLMWRRDVVDAALWHRPLAGAMVVFVDPGATWALHLVAGRVRFEGDLLPEMATGDTALLRHRGGRTRYAFDGGGEALLVRIDPRSDTAVR
ncbi:HutD/Ves family protein [Luteimonas kalidii]|uniref:HutD/Ves family protein n=1 Tax=Luteimonas kalidii TaxID=3042025 RepID=UPI003CE5002D